MESPITNFAKVDENLWRGARPDADGVAWLVFNGCKTVISLEWEQSDIPAANIIEIRLADWEPLPRFAPVIEDRHIRSVLAAIKTSPKPIFIHCRSGQNRTGVAVAAYRIIIKNDPIEDVIAEMKSYGGIWADSDVDYVRSLETRRLLFL